MARTKTDGAQLREQAVAFIHSSKKQKHHMSNESLETLVEELNIYQTELELQNDELIETTNRFSEHVRHYKFLFENLPTPAFLLDEKGMIKHINESALSLVKFRSPNQARNHSAHRLFKENNQSWLFDVLAKGLANESYESELLLTNLNNEAIHVVAKVVLLPTNAAMDAKAVMVINDVSSEYALEHKSALLDSLLDNSQFIIFAINEKKELLFANKAFAHYYNVTIEESSVINILDLISDESLKRLEKIYDPLFIRGETLDYQFSYYDNSLLETRYFTTNAFPMLMQDGTQFGAGFITQDITEKVKTEESLQTAAEIFKEGHEGIIITDSKFSVISVNNAYSDITGYAESESLGNDCSFLIPFIDPSSVEYKSVHSRLQHTGHWEGEHHALVKNNKPVPLWLSITKTPRKGALVKNYIFVFSDISEKIESQKEIEKLAYFDPLTGIPNRRLLKDRAEQLIEQAARKKAEFILAFVDLDHFKEINDLHGHEVGDSLLKEVSNRLLHLLRSSDTLCRLGGDEFVMLMPDMSKSYVTSKLRKVLGEIVKPYHIEGLKLNLSASIGVVSYPGDGGTYQELLQHADTAMYEAKTKGKNRYRFFESSLLEKLQRKVNMDEAMRSALEKDEFSIVYQPKVELATGQIIGCEALARWRSAQLGSLLPDVFIPVAEENGMILELGNWVLQRVVKDFAGLANTFNKPFNVSINLSANQFWEAGFTDLATGLLTEYKTKNLTFEFELTEYTAMHKPELSKAILLELKQADAVISLDDFGTGYSSLSYLKHLPIDTVKIDRSFVSDIGNNKDDELICQSIISLAHSLQMNTVAEGIQNKSQEAFLLGCGCEVGQGFGLYKPMSLRSLLDLLRQQV